MNVKNKFKLSSLALASAMAMGAMSMPTVASAEVSSSATLSSMYLWRGQDVSTGKPTLSGDITYKHDSGAYAFGWLSSEGSNSYEADFGVGYAGKMGSVGYDVSYYKYWYPTTNTGGKTGQSFSEAGAEYVIGLTFEPVTFKAFLDATNPIDYTYFTLSGSVGKFGLTYGFHNPKASGKEYSHLDITYSATDKLSFTLSNPMSVGSGKPIDKDPLMMMSYSLPI
ncbi:MAG: TorF family putative porin [Gammaproteobacteria bacterium]|nr:TorF family putative porin [Gammaproteobacteria bacterium]